jgi:hypothetical protein
MTIPEDWPLVALLIGMGKTRQDMIVQPQTKAFSYGSLIFLMPALWNEIDLQRNCEKRLGST